MIRHYWPQFLVVSPIMNPTKSMMICNLLELRCIITQKCGNHRYVCTLMICRNCTGFKNFLLGSLISIRRENIIEFSTHFFVTEYFVFNRRELFHPDLGNIKRFHQIKCFIIKVCLLYTSDAADEEDSVDLGGRRIIKKKKKKKKKKNKQKTKESEEGKRRPSEEREQTMQ